MIYAATEIVHLRNMSAAARYRNNSFPGAPDDLYRVWLLNISNLMDVRQGAKPVLVCASHRYLQQQLLLRLSAAY